MPTLVSAHAPTYEELRPLKPSRGRGFPVYPDLVDHLARTPGAEPDDRIRHALAVCAAYAYADPPTVAMIMARMGMEGNRCLAVTQAVDAMFIRSAACVLQSRCGRVAVVAYRGTMPTSLVNWMTDAEVSPEKVSFSLDGEDVASRLHAGFYRNVRATRYEVVSALGRALAGRSVIRGEEEHALEHPLQALYVTGHSLGGAMAAVLALMLRADPDFAPLRERLRAVYTYGQPMIGDRALARRCGDDAFLGQRVFRYRYGFDVVPELPPRAAGDFGHFGREFQYQRGKEGDGRWVAAAPTGQLPSLLELPAAAAAFFAHQFESLRNMPFQHSFEDHGPQHYVQALTPPGVHSEFGD